MIRSVTSAYRILSFRDPCFSVIHLFRLSNRRGGEFVDVVRTHAVVVTFRRAFAGKPLGEPIKGGRVEALHFLDDRAVDLTLFNALVAEKRARNLRLRERQVEKKAISKCRKPAVARRTPVWCSTILGRVFTISRPSGSPR